MLAKIFSATHWGLDAKIIEIEVDISNGMPATTIVGLADASIRESKERVRSCIKNSHFSYPRNRISINLAPAHIYKYGTHFDLGIALGILKASGQLKLGESREKRLFFGELALDGRVRGCKGIFPMLVAAASQGFKDVFVPAENAAEASLVPGIRILPVENIFKLIEFLCGRAPLRIPPPTTIKHAAANVVLDPQNSPFDFSEIYGHAFAKRGLEIAAAGGHNISFIGSPGVGKTMLAKAMLSILPDPSPEERLEILKIYSIAGLLEGNFPRIPFRNPHHSVSPRAFTGGGAVLRPGEISLAHNGVLFLDEFPEFPREIIESLRGPLEAGFITVSRANYNYILPARFILVTARNPCPCGYYGDFSKECVCGAGKINAYRRKLSGPIIDRLDININVPRINFLQFKNTTPEPSAEVFKGVISARAVQQERFSARGITAGRMNSSASPAEIKRLFRVSRQSEKLLLEADAKARFSPRSYFKILKLARTIADLSPSEDVLPEHCAEALQYRFPNFE